MELIQTKKIGKRGFYPLFTTLGVVLIVIVMAISMQWGAEETKSYTSHIDRLSWLRINHAANNVRTMASSSIRDAVYEAVAGVGEINEGNVNPFLNYGKEEGWFKIVENITEEASSRISDIMPNLADYSDGRYSTFLFENGINITIGEITGDSLRVVENGDEVVAVIELPMVATSRYEGWEVTVPESNITIPLKIRLKDMYYRAWEFNKNYEENVKWLVSGFIYARAYFNAYLGCDGPFLKEGHFDFDPVGTLLFGDLQTVKDFAANASLVKEAGAIPISTWMAETWYLSEPSFLPAGFDITSEDEEQLEEAISGAFASGELEEQACEGLSGAKQEDCEVMYDSEKLETMIDNLTAQKDVYDDIWRPLDKWLNAYDLTDYDSCTNCEQDRRACKDKCETKYKTCLSKCGGSSKCKKRCKEKRTNCRDNCDEDYDNCDPDKQEECRHDKLNAIFSTSNSECDEFRDETVAIIEDAVFILGEIDPGQCEAALDHARKNADHADAGSAQDDFEKNNETYGFSQIEEYCDMYVDALDDLESVMNNELMPSDISDSKCLDSRKKGDCLFDSECEDEDDCDVNCRPPSCASSGYSYDCVGDKPLRTSRTEKCEVCDDDGDCRDRSDTISQCTCRCRPSVDLLRRLNEDLAMLEAYLEKVGDTFDRNIAKFEEQLERQEKLDELEEKFESTDAEKIKYDVFARITPHYVKYDKGKGMGGKLCYFNPAFSDVNKGVCGDSLASVVTYTVQVALASFVGATAFAADFFPMFFETEAKYNLTETLIDDGNRVILKNVAGEGGELYTYAPFEFEIYKEKEFDMGSATFGKTLVYLYLPSVKVKAGAVCVNNKVLALGRVIDGLAHSSCGGDSC